MQRILTVIKYTVLRNLRDIGNTIGQMLIFPIVLILILGMALSPMFQPGSFEATNVGYLNEDQGHMGTLLDEFMANPEINELLAIQAVENHDTGLEMLKNGTITALIHVESDYTEKVMAGGEAVIQITGHPASPMNVTLVETVMEGFTYGGNAIQAMTGMGFQPQYSPAVDSIEDLPLSAEGLMPGAMDYYAVTMLVMIIMYGTLYSAHSLKHSYLANVGRRIKTTPIRPREQYIGLILANVATVYTQVLVIMAFTHFVYGVSWGENLGLILLITFILVNLAMGLGAMIIMVCKDVSRASGLLNVLIVGFTFIAGGYFKVTLPGALEYVQYLSPNYLAQTAIFNTIYGGPADQTALMIAGLLAFVAVTFAAAMLAERRAEQ